MYILSTINRKKRNGFKNTIIVRFKPKYVLEFLDKFFINILLHLILHEQCGH